MKTPHTIMVYDDNCPLCEAYTSAFIKTGFLDKEGRQSFTAVNNDILCKIDQVRCRDEIPLVDTDSGKVLYGIDAMVEVLGRKIPFIKKIAVLLPINWFIRKLYKLISYNRRVIVAAEKKDAGFDCTPNFNIPYRLAFIFICLVFNTLMLLPVQAYVVDRSLLQNLSALQLQQSHFIFVFCNIGLSFFLKKERAIEYLGQVTMLALCTILLSIPLIFINRYLHVIPLVNTILLACILIGITKEYFRRMKFAAVYPHHKAIMTANFICLITFLFYLVW